MILRLSCSFALLLSLLLLFPLPSSAQFGSHVFEQLFQQQGHPGQGGGQGGAGHAAIYKQHADAGASGALVISSLASGLMSFLSRWTTVSCPNYLCPKSALLCPTSHPLFLKSPTSQDPRLRQETHPMPLPRPRRHQVRRAGRRRRDRRLRPRLAGVRKGRRGIEVVEGQVAVCNSIASGTGQCNGCKSLACGRSLSALPFAFPSLWSFKSLFFIGQHHVCTAPSSQWKMSDGVTDAKTTLLETCSPSRAVLWRFRLFLSDPPRDRASRG